ncbi:hypothetical protein FHS39_001168 [Streptomyces olivoverticillatus]|uniref:Uncharacterized protein n=1 Tax=Streptomyces olivoverticillatus TaxID=66427 RepID=A0A7W7PJI5_9ACTN|nr:hypothetical protein [Streptomyces olivoverticillatus]MBB4892157.1 hypothetical protein [Streptomyces olivoverticillatus]
MQTMPAQPSRRNRFMTALAITLWAISAKTTALCLAVALMIAAWGAADEHPREAAQFLLQVGGVLALAGVVLTAIWHALRLFRLSAATRYAITGALACPGPVWLALRVYFGH